MAHSFLSKWTPTEADWKKLPELVALRATPTDCFMCSNGCGLSAVVGLKVWVDFSAPQLVTDMAGSPCPYAQISSTSASASASASARSGVVHARVDLAATLTKLKLSSLAPQPDVLTMDGRYTAHLSEAARVALNTAHTIEPPTIKNQSFRLIRQILKTVMAVLNGAMAPALATESKDYAVPNSAIIEGHTGDTKLSDNLQGALVLLSVARGLFDRAEMLQTLQANYYRTTGKKGKAFQSHQNAWLKAMHTSLGSDFAAVRDTLEKPERLLSPLKYLDQNTFMVLGLAVTTNDASAVRTYLRLELPRETQEAKRIGWNKPSPANGNKPSPTRTTATGAGAAADAAGADGDDDDKTDGDKADTNPTKKKRKRGGGRPNGGGNKDKK